MKREKLMFAKEYFEVVIEKDNILKELKQLIKLNNISFMDDYAEKYYHIWKNTLNLINSCLYLRGENIYAAYCLAASVVENILYILVIDDNPKERLEDFVNFSKIDKLIEEQSEELKDKSFNKFLKPCKTKWKYYLEKCLKINFKKDIYNKKSYYRDWYNIYDIKSISKLHKLIKNKHRKKVYQEYYNKHYTFLCTYKHLHFITLKIASDDSNYITLTNFITDLLVFSLFNLACIIEQYSSVKNREKINELADRYIQLDEKIKND